MQVQESVKEVSKKQDELQDQVNQCMLGRFAMVTVSARVDTMAHLQLSLTSQISDLATKAKELQVAALAVQVGLAWP